MAQLTASQYRALFARVGKYIKAANSYLTLQGTLDTSRAEIAGTFDEVEVAITGISKASAAVVTAAGHRFAVGDQVYFLGVVGMTEINTLTGTVTAVADGTFTVNINSSGFTTWTGGGTATLAGTSIRRDLIQSLPGQYAGFESGVQGWINSLVGNVSGVLADLRKDLGVPSSTPEAILSALILDMNDDTAPRSAAQTVNASTVSTPSVATVATPTGNGMILCSTTWDGTLTDERSISEVVTARCVSDVSTGATAGNERFTLTGYPSRNAADGINARGSGNGPTITVAAAGGASPVSPNVLPYGDFETWSDANTPTGWTKSSGTTQIVRSATRYRGSYALSLVSDGSQTPIVVTQAIATRLQAGTMYCLAFYMRHVGASAPDGLSTFTAGVSGSPPTVTAYAFNANPSGLTSSFVRYNVFFICPDGVPSNLTLSFYWLDSNLVTSGRGIIIDSVTIAPAVNFGKIWYAAVRGTTDFLIDDRFRVTTANDYGGVIQTFFGRFYGALLPSNAAGGETISDTLAT